MPIHEISCQLPCDEEVFDLFNLEAREDIVDPGRSIMDVLNKFFDNRTELEVSFTLLDSFTIIHCQSDLTLAQPNILHC